jgi:hypothetical protein
MVWNEQRGGQLQGKQMKVGRGKGLSFVWICDGFFDFASLLDLVLCSPLSINSSSHHHTCSPVLPSNLPSVDSLL